MLQGRLTGLIRTLIFNPASSPSRLRPKLLPPRPKSLLAINNASLREHDIFLPFSLLSSASNPGLLPSAVLSTNELLQKGTLSSQLQLQIQPHSLPAMCPPQQAVPLLTEEAQCLHAHNFFSAPQKRRGTRKHDRSPGDMKENGVPSTLHHAWWLSSHD